MKKTLKELGNWLKTKVGPKIKNGVRTVYLKLRSRAWPKIKAAGIWLWTHKKEKRVWLTTAAVILVTPVLIAFILWAIYHAAMSFLFGHSTISAGHSAAVPTVLWIMLILLALSCLPFVVMLWVLKWQGTITNATLKKAHLILGVILATVAAGVTLTTLVPWGETFSWFKDQISYGLNLYWNSIPYPLPVTLVIVLLLAALLRKKKSGTTAAASEGGEKSALGTVVLFVLIICSINFLAAIVMLAKEQIDRQLGGGTTASASGRQAGLPRSDSYAVTADVWTPVAIGQGVNAVWQAPQKYQFRYNSETNTFEDGPSVYMKMPARRSPYTVYFRAAESPTTVVVYKTTAP